MGPVVYGAIRSHVRRVWRNFAIGLLLVSMLLLAYLPDVIEGGLIISWQWLLILPFVAVAEIADLAHLIWHYEKGTFGDCRFEAKLIKKYFLRRYWEDGLYQEDDLKALKVAEFLQDRGVNILMF